MEGEGGQGGRRAGRAARGTTAPAAQAASSITAMPAGSQSAADGVQVGGHPGLVDDDDGAGAVGQARGSIVSGVRFSVIGVDVGEDRLRPDVAGGSSRSR